MNWTYIIPIVLITALLTATIMNTMPLLTSYIKHYINVVRTRFTPKPKTDCSLLEARIDELEKKLAKRQENFRTAIRQEIKNILLELKNK